MTATTSSDAERGESNNTVIAIATGVSLGFCALLALVGLLVWFTRKKRRQNNENATQSEAARVPDSEIHQQHESRAVNTAISKTGESGEPVEAPTVGAELVELG